MGGSESWLLTSALHSELSASSKDSGGGGRGQAEPTVACHPCLDDGHLRPGFSYAALPATE